MLPAQIALARPSAAPVLELAVVAGDVGPSVAVPKGGSVDASVRIASGTRNLVCVDVPLRWRFICGVPFPVRGLVVNGH